MQAHQFDEDRPSRRKVTSGGDAQLFEKYKKYWTSCFTIKSVLMINICVLHSTESRRKLVKSLAPRPMGMLFVFSSILNNLILVVHVFFC